jgi:hypothetical protein
MSEKQLELDANLQQNYEMTYYEAGHFMYVQLSAIAQLKGDVARLTKTAVYN